MIILQPKVLNKVNTNTYVEAEKNYMSKYFTKSIKFLPYHNTHTESTNVLKVRILYPRF